MSETDKTATIKKANTTEENEVYRAYRFDFDNCEFKNCVFYNVGEPPDPPDDPPDIEDPEKVKP